MEEGVSINVDGVDYTVRTGDLSALDAQALRKELGLSFIGLMKALQDDPDIDLIAGIVWLSRRVSGEPMLTYSEVAKDIGYDLEVKVANAEAPTTEEMDSPEA
ncbi:MAG: hypothetical protein ACRD1X_04070 [Vicinamibacteria bacterium]